MSQPVLIRTMPLQRLARAGFRQAAKQRCIQVAVSRRAYATEKEELPEFKAQLWESTSERVKREREEQARFAQRRNLGGGGTGAAFTAGKSTHEMASRSPDTARPQHSLWPPDSATGSAA